MRVTLVVLHFFIPLFLFAQTRTISGKVSDEKGVPLAAVSVIVKGTNTGTQTDASGNFSLPVAGTGKVKLIITYLGYKNREITAGEVKTVSVQLEKDENSLDDVVVIGYGTMKKRDLSGSVSSMAGKDFEKIPISSVAEAITGRLPGVTVTTTDGAPGAEVVIRVRGGGSITQDNSPLYIVDGFPVDNINNISPADIERFDVLKDAASSAIYGARGANGVIIITTKSAKAGKTQISYNGFTQWRKFPKDRQLDVLSPYEYVLAQYEYARIRNQSEVDNFTKYFGVYEDLELYKSQKGTNWQRKLFGNAAESQQHNLSILGGTEKTKMSLNVTHNKDEGIMVGSGYQRTYMNFKLNHEVSKSLRFELASRFSNAITDGAGTSGTSNVRISDGVTTRPVNGIADAIEIDPTAVASGDDDYDQFLKSLISPLELAAQDYRKRADKIFNMSAAVNWTILRGLTYRSELGLDYGFNEIKRYYGPLTGESRNVGGNLPLGEITDNKTQKYRWANTLTYKFKKGADHDFNVMIGQEIIDGGGFSKFTRAKYFAVNVQPDVLFANMSLGTPDRQSTFESPHDKLVSFFGRAQYQLKGKYIFNITTRGDASSKFAPGKRLGIFPAASAAWHISQEDFMENVGFISELKLRASYGHAGNNRIDNNMFRRTYVISDLRTIGFGDVAQPYWAFGSRILDNPDLRWETTITRNLGLDFSLWNNRISGSLDMYMNTTKDLLVQSDIPQTTGFPFQMRNIGQTSNRGIELNLNATIINKRDFSLSASFNVGINRSNIDKLDGVDERAMNSGWAGTDLKSQDDYRLMVGETVGLIYGYVTDGFYTSDDFESYNAATRTYKLNKGVPDVGSFLGGISLRPGVLKLRDLDSNGLINASDRQVIGRALPKASGGFGFNASYKGFDASVFFNWMYGNDVYNSGKISFNMYHRTTYGNMSNTVNSTNRYKYIDGNGQQVTDLAALAELNKNATIWSPFSMGNASPVIHSWAIEDGSFLRLNNVSVGYSFPRKLTSRVGLSKFRLYGTIYNAWLWTKYSGYDPEVSATRNSSYAALTPGVDYSAYPKSRSFTVGINVTF